jgi:hypothetical protein
MKCPSECIIIGGGKSIKEGIELGLKNLLKDKFVITCNYAYRHFTPTIETFVDGDFYKDNLETLKTLPCIIGNKSQVAEKYLLPNTTLYPPGSIYYGKDSLEKGVYSPILTGIWSITLAICLMKQQGTIYLLGYDWTQEGDTHYYSKEEINHRGQGRVTFYKKHNADKYFKTFLIEKNIKIYNVSLNSQLQSFEKISYLSFFNLLNS